MPDVRAVIQESWSKAVLAASSVEDQAQELVARVGQALSESPLSAENAQRMLTEVAAQLADHRAKLQAQVEDTVRRGLERLRLPSHGDLKALGARLSELEARLARFEARQKGDS